VKRRAVSRNSSSTIRNLSSPGIMNLGPAGQQSVRRASDGLVRLTVPWELRAVERSRGFVCDLELRMNQLVVESWQVEGEGWIVHECATRCARDEGGSVAGDGLNTGVRGLWGLAGGSAAEVFHGKRRPIADGWCLSAHVD
jgi:hypothetical protein